MLSMYDSITNSRGDVRMVRREVFHKYLMELCNQEYNGNLLETLDNISYCEVY
jgi:hypothetical protein